MQIARAIHDQPCSRLSPPSLRTPKTPRVLGSEPQFLPSVIALTSVRSTTSRSDATARQRGTDDRLSAWPVREKHYGGGVCRCVHACPLGNEPAVVADHNGTLYFRIRQHGSGETPVRTDDPVELRPFGLAKPPTGCGRLGGGDRAVKMLPSR